MGGSQEELIYNSRNCFKRLNLQRISVQLLSTIVEIVLND